MINYLFIYGLNMNRTQNWCFRLSSVLFILLFACGVLRQWLVRRIRSSLSLVLTPDLSAWCQEWPMGQETMQMAPGVLRKHLWLNIFLTLSQEWQFYAYAIFAAMTGFTLAVPLFVSLFRADIWQSRSLSFWFKCSKGRVLFLVN